MCKLTEMRENRIGMKRKERKGAALTASLILVSLLVTLPPPLAHAAPDSTPDSTEGTQERVNETNEKTAESRAGEDENRHGAVSPDAYNEFGLPVDTIDEYMSDDHPMENYEPALKSWLYMSYINKTSANN